MYSNITTSWSSSVSHHIILISWHQLLYNYNIFTFQSGRSVKNYWYSGPALVLLGSFNTIPFTIRNLGLGVTVPHQILLSMCTSISLPGIHISAYQQLPEISILLKTKSVITINVPVVFMALYVMVLRGATSLRGALEGVVPENRVYMSSIAVEMGRGRSMYYAAFMPSVFVVGISYSVFRLHMSCRNATPPPPTALLLNI